MNLGHLHDVFDHWKGSVIRTVVAVLHDLHVVPLCTGEAWTQEERRLYAELMGVLLNHVLLPDQLFENRAKRQAYFVPCQPDHKYDLFLDPDTGVEPDSGCTRCHVTLDDLDYLLPQCSPGLVMVYQHSPRAGDNTEAVREKLRRMQQRGLSACAYS